ILSRLNTLHREAYVPAAYQSMAFADIEIPLNAKSKMWSPKMQARVVQDLGLRPDDVVVEVGTGSGYPTALMASLCKQVLSYEIDPELASQARAHLAHSPNVTVRNEDGLKATFSVKPTVLVLTGAIDALPAACVAQLAEQARMFAVVGAAPVMRATLFSRDDAQDFQTKVLFETVIESLSAPATPKKFSL
ncbi:MAG: hypothetical protein RLZZ502_1565, partial [Pseudomonadota bacterium]